MGARLIAVTAISGLAAVAIVGLASAGLKTKQVEVSVAPGTEETVVAKCKRGTRAVSGGFDAPGFNADASNDTFVETFTSKRSGKRGWAATARNHPSAGELGPLVDSAYCSDELPKVKTKSATTTIPDGERRSVAARCPRGGEAVSGGFEAGINPETSDGAFPFESRRVGKRKWQVTAMTFSSGEAFDMTAYAYCAKNKLGLKKAVATTSGAAFSIDLTATAECGRNQRVISGGFDSTFEDPTEFDNTAPFQSFRVGKRSWQAAAAYYNGGDDDAVDWSVYAYCLKKEKKG